MKESEHSGPYRDLGFLPDVRVTHSCLHEMEENPLVSFIFKGIEEEKAKLPANLSLQQVSVTVSFQPQKCGYEATALILHIQDSQQSFTMHSGCSDPIPHGTHHLSPKSHHKPELTTTGALLLSVFPFPK